MERDRPTHGGFPGEASDQPRSETVGVMLSIMPASEWYAIESAARATDDTLADFYRQKAQYGRRRP